MLLRPVVAVPPGGPLEPRMRRWEAVMPRGGGGMVGHYWNTTTEAWFEVNPQMFLSFPYVGMDFRGDLDIGLSPGFSYGPKGTLFMFSTFI